MTSTNRDKQGFIYAVFLGTDNWDLGFVIPPELLDSELQEVMNETLDTPLTTEEEIHE